MPRYQKIVFRLALCAALLAISYLATTGQEYPVVRAISDKINHIAAFCALAFLLDFSFPQSELGVAKILLLLGYGLLIEIVQSFLPHRTASLFDLLADAAGIALYRLALPALKYAPLVCQRWTATP
jgi:VanZ family protein